MPVTTRSGLRTAESPEPSSQRQGPRTSPRRGRRYLGQVLGTGQPVLSAPSPRTTAFPRSARDRPPTPYVRRTSLPRGERPAPSSRRPGLSRPADDGWRPSIVIGRSLGENLSRAERARREVRQWEAVYEHTLRTTPEGVGPILEQLEVARNELAGMEMNEEDGTPVNDLPSTHQAAVASRLLTLHAALGTSRSPAEAANIRAAIRAYESATIPYWTRWTIFWNGRVVDHCDSYRSFCEDRGARLDRYEGEHGPGWLWYEAPLGPADEEVRTGGQAMRATSSVQSRNGWGMGSWSITMGFRRVKAYVSRSDPSPKSTLKRRQPRTPSPPHDSGSDAESCKLPRTATPSTDLTLADDPTAPNVHFDMLLDSGATFPLLYERDINALGINRETYPAQTVQSIATVDGTFDSRLYEVRVTVTTEDGVSLVDPRRPVYPRERHELGALVPVAVLPRSGGTGNAPPSPVVIRNGKRAKPRTGTVPGQRLSGQLPFMACYVSVVPGSQTIWLGEDRRDVLGADKFPGQRRFLADAGDEAGGLRSMAWRAPGVRFEHRVGGGLRLVDEEKRGDGGASEVRVEDGEGEVRGRWRVEPRRRRGRWRKGEV